MILPNILIDGTVKSALDIGANIGHWALGVHSYNPKVDIFMIEGNPACAEYLERTGIPFKIACLSDVEQKVKMYVNKNNEVCTGVSYYLEQTKHYTEDNFIEVDTRLLDDVIVAQFGEIPSFDYIKMDTQGSELDILEGASRTIEKAKFIQIEMSLIEYNKDSPSKQKVTEYLEHIGFYPNHLIERLHWEMNPAKDVIQEDWLFGRERVSLDTRVVHQGIPEVIIT
jgi:FkbM family methyltransferase